MCFSFFLFLVFLFSETLCHRHTWPRQRVVHDIAEQIENGSLMEEMKHISELIASKRRNASGLLITCYDYIGVEKFAARWSATKCEISTLNSPSCCHQLVQQLIIIG